MTSLIYLVFLLSGISGLVYQVIWVREFGQMFGNTVQSASLVTGIFTLGLGLGSYFAGPFIDRKNESDPKAGLRYYAYAELLIGALALVVALVTPQLERLSPLISRYARGEHGWFELTAMSYFWRYLVAVVCVGPITVLMGATLTFLVRFVLSRSLEQAGRKIGVLYGMNTLGAAIGCALVDLWAVPAIGLMHTRTIAVALNVIAGSSALCLARTLKELALKAAAPPPATPTAVPVTAENRKRWLTYAGTAIAISGFCAMGMEIVWFRFLTSVYSSSRYVFSLLLVTILVGMWLGSFIGGRLSAKWRKPEELYIASQLLFSSSILACLYAFLDSDRRFLIDLFRDVFYGPKALSQQSVLFSLYDYSVILVPAFMTLFVPALFMGAAFPLVNAIVQKDASTAGSAAGRIYLYNCAGATLGSLVTGFVLLPAIGMQKSVSVLCVGAALAALPVLLIGAPGASQCAILVRPHSAALTIVFIALGASWLAKPDDYLVRRSLFADPTTTLNQTWIKVSEGINEVAMVAEGREGEGEEATVWRQLYTNGHMMSGTDYFSLRYMSSFVHIPLLQVDEPKSVLVLCFGVGNTLYAASLYPSVSRLEVADLSKNVLELAPYFGQWNKNVLQDTRVAVFVNDGRQHLRMQPDNQYDLVTLEPPPLSHAGVASLYSEEFYRIVYRTLKKGGYLSQWLPMYQVAEEHNLRLIKAFIDVFPNAVLLNGANKEFILLGQKEGPNRIDWKAAERRLSANDKVKREVEGLDLATPVERLGMFAASPNWLSMATRNVEPMTDDDPVIENNHFLRDRSMPKEIFNTSGLADWCPACFGEGSLASELAPLPYYLQVLQDIYSNDQFLLEGPFVPPREAYRIGFSKVDAGNVPIDSAHSVRHPTPQRFEELLRRYPYLAAFGPDWAFRYAR